MNDSSRSNKWFASGLQEEIAGFDANGHGGADLLRQLDAAILKFDIAATTATANAYLRSGASVPDYFASVAYTACKFQDDPHNQKICHSAFEEYELSTSHMKDRLLLAAVRQLAGWPKMPGERDCFARYESEWSKH